MDLSQTGSFQDAVVTVMGLGRFKQGSGLGTAKWLMRHGAQAVITDLKDENELKESVDMVMEWYHTYREQFPEKTIYQPIFVLGEHRREDFVSVACVVQNPGVPSESEFVQAAKAAGVPIESDISLFFRYFPHPIMAVTGTKGKTTTTLLLGEMVKALDSAAVTAGNIRVSPLEHLDDLLARPEATPVVLELSSWLLESLPTALQQLGHGPEIAVLTNVYPDHLNRYASFADYVRSKEIIFAYQTKAQYAVLNRDHDLVRSMEPRVPSTVFWFSRTDEGLPNGCFIKGADIIFRRNGEETMIVPVAEVALKGEHNMENVLSAACAAMLRDVPAAAVAQVLRTFAGVPDRQELVREVDEIEYINDTAATAPTATVAALRRFGKDKRVILIAGGVDKNLPYEEMGEEIVRAVKALILFPGTASDLIEPLVIGKTPIHRADSMREAVQKARKMGENGDIVLLSPGAASFNMFKNEFDRGEQFREEVRNL